MTAKEQLNAIRDRDGIYHLTRDGLDWIGASIGITIHDEIF